jgi:hypothetical protein
MDAPAPLADAPDLPADRSFEVWIDGAEDVRGLVRAVTMLAARRRFLGGLRTIGTRIGGRRVRARVLTEGEAGELYPPALRASAARGG